MAKKEVRTRLLRALPGIDHLLERMKTDAWFADVPRSVRAASAREAIDSLRTEILNGAPHDDDSFLDDDAVMGRVKNDGK